MSDVPGVYKTIIRRILAQWRQPSMLSARSEESTRGEIYPVLNGKTPNCEGLEQRRNRLSIALGLNSGTGGRSLIKAQVGSHGRQWEVCAEKWLRSS